MGNNNDNVIFLELLEWFDQTGREMVQKLPREGSAAIKWGAQLVVRESQVGIFFYNGKAIQVFGPGRHTLKTSNIPILNKLISVPWGLDSPLRAEVYFINMKVFPDLKWGTRDPVAFKDSELGLIRLRAFGIFNIRVIQPLLFVNSLIGTLNSFTTEAIEEYLSRVIVSKLNDYMGERLDTILDLPGQYQDWAEGLQKDLVHDLKHFGLSLDNLYINSISPPQEVQQAIDDRSKLGLFEDTNKLMQVKSSMSMEKAAESQGTAGEGMGMSMGMMMPAMMQQFSNKPEEQKKSGEQQECPDCRHLVPSDAGFCPYCGHQIMVISQCENCGKNLPAHAKFCPKCGIGVQSGDTGRYCPSCGSENMKNSNFCNNCGERI